MFELNFAKGRLRGSVLGAVAFACLWSFSGAEAVAKHPSPNRAPRQARGAGAPGAGFSFGQPQGTTVGAPGCGTNQDGEPSVHVSRAGDVFMASEFGLGSGSDL